MLSMLSVKYVLLPLDLELPKAIPKLPEAELITKNSPIKIPGNGSLFVDATTIPLDRKRYYQIELTVLAPNPDTQAFYVDFYGGPEYDKPEQKTRLLFR